MMLDLFHPHLSRPYHHDQVTLFPHLPACPSALGCKSFRFSCSASELLTLCKGHPPTTPCVRRNLVTLRVFARQNLVSEYLCVTLYDSVK